MLQEEALSVADVHQNGSWQQGKFSIIIPQEVVDRIAATPIQLFSEKEDTMTWKFSQDGDSNLASTYTLSLHDALPISIASYRFGEHQPRIELLLEA